MRPPTRQDHCSCPKVVLHLAPTQAHRHAIYYTHEQRQSQRGATRAPAPPTAMIYMEPGLSPSYRLGCV
jgi:hypothetical protein